MRVPLHPDSVAFIQRVERPGVLPFYLQPPATQRMAQEKMLVAFAPPPPAMAVVRNGEIERSEAEGGALSYRLPYRLYRPLGSRADESLPALCWFHGGGWTVGSLDGFDTVCRELANLSGCVVLALAYRRAPEHPFPAAMNDSFAAVRWFAAHAAKLGIDATRLAVGGDSAGGNLSIVTALRCRDEHGPALRFQLLVYPDTDKRGMTASHQEFAQGPVLTRELLHTFRRNYLPDEADFLDWRASPILAQTLAGLPPALIIAASHDPLLDDGLAYAKRLKAEGVAVEYIEYPGMVHNFFTLGGIIPTANQAVAQAAAALKTALAVQS